MRKLTILLCLGLMPLTLLAQPADRNEQREWLIQQIRLGEATHRENLVEDSLARLRLLEPNNLDALAASIRQAVRTREFDRARQLYSDLHRLAPDSPQDRQMARLLEMSEGDGAQVLQQVRLLATAGRFEEALARYEAAFGKGEPPSLELALEYWRTRSQLPNQLPTTIEHLYALDKQYPGSPELQQFLADLLFRAERDDEALAVVKRMAGESQSRSLAADLEYAYLSRQPVSDASVRGWQQFLERYPGDSHEAQVLELLAGQQKLTGDPAWRAGQQGIRLLAQGGSPVVAERNLRQALAGYPDNATLKGYLGVALAQQGRREEAAGWFKQALAEEKDTRIISKWFNLEASNTYWMLIQRGRKALNAGNLNAAQQAYAQAAKGDPGEPMALMGLGDVAMARNQLAHAEQYYLQASRLKPGNQSTVRALARLYQAQSPQRYAQYLSSLPAKQRQWAAQPGGGGQSGGGSQVELLRGQSRQALEREDWAGAERLLIQARQLAPNDVWLASDLARALRMQNQAAQADAVFADLLSRQGQEPTARFAHGLYLESSGRNQDGLDTLARVPTAQWSDGMQALHKRLQRRVIAERARTLIDSGDTAGAMALLEGQLDTRQPLEQQVDDLLQLAEWSRQTDNLSAADGYYGRVLALQSSNAQARLGRIEVLIERGDTAAARQLLQRDEPQIDAERVSARRRLANVWAAVGERDKARAILADAAQRKTAPDAVLYRDLARMVPREQADQALDYYALAMQDADLLTAEQANPRDNIALTRASRANDDDDWLRTSLRRDVDQLYTFQSPTVTIQEDYGWRDNAGAKGISDLTTSTTMVHGQMPVGEGLGFARVEQVSLRATRFETGDDGLHREAFGSCSFRGRTAAGAVPSGCPSGRETSDGVTLAAGWTHDRVSADIGTSPMGFEVQNILGGVTVDGKAHDIGWSLTGSRRPMDNSLLSYAGAKDPRTGISWGGVTATGVTLGLSHDQGLDDGVWASLGYHWIQGKNVADNTRWRVMGGYYYRLINRADEQLRIGASAMTWHYDRDLSDYTLGHGGYYSPQRYLSFGLPANYAWRNADWSLYLEGSIGYSWTHTDEERVFPLTSVNDDILNPYGPLQSSTINDTREGGSNKGFGYRAQALVERRLDDHWVLGGGFTLQRSEDYSPNGALLYLRYSFDPWQGNLPLPVTPLIPYAAFR